MSRRCKNVKRMCECPERVRLLEGVSVSRKRRNIPNPKTLRIFGRDKNVQKKYGCQGGVGNIQKIEECPERVRMSRMCECKCIE